MNTVSSTGSITNSSNVNFHWSPRNATGLSIRVEFYLFKLLKSILIIVFR